MASDGKNKRYNNGSAILNISGPEQLESDELSRAPPNVRRARPHHEAVVRKAGDFVSPQLVGRVRTIGNDPKTLFFTPRLDRLAREYRPTLIKYAILMPREVEAFEDRKFVS
jgi:hypothetical protein